MIVNPETAFLERPDRIEVKNPEEKTTEEESNVGGIVGGVIGAAAVISILSIAGYIYMKRTSSLSKTMPENGKTPHHHLTTDDNS